MSFRLLALIMAMIFPWLSQAMASGIATKSDVRLGQTRAECLSQAKDSISNAGHAISLGVSKNGAYGWKSGEDKMFNFLYITCSESGIAEILSYSEQNKGAGDSAEAVLNTLVSALPKAPALPSPGQVFRDCPECPELVVVPSGSFMMGSPESEPERGSSEGPRHRVTLGYALAVGKFEVTFAEWDACVAGGGCDGYRPKDEGWGRGRRPVINVSWDDAKTYVKWLSQKTGQRYRLLSESEWEYVARAGTNTPFNTGQRITTDQANFNGDATYNGSSKGRDRKRTVEVGSFPANSFGLHDVHGNVWEWTADCLHDNYSGAPSDGRAWTTGDCKLRVFRGGSWLNYPGVLRSAYRNGDSPDSRNYHVGFRVARTITP
ncbi:MAG: formylglycine-generating enzyme family protein [Rhodospirillaceae bacterium]